MELLNTTAVPAAVHVAEVQGELHRLCFVCAKASFAFDHAGNVRPESESPTPLFNQDVETDLGLLPRDDLPAIQPRFDVILLGTAHAPGGRPTTQMKVGLSVGKERRELLVTGDRVWDGKGTSARIGSALPFLSMPLTYARAFGGRGEVLIDRDAAVEITDPRNPDGRGIDVGRDAAALGAAMKVPPGYPVLPEAPRPLPNLEDPAEPIRSWEDSPEPACWATLPLGCSTHGLRAVDQDELARGEEALAALPLKADVYQRACPSWVIAPPPTGARVSMSGLFAETPRVDLQLPTLSVVADICVGEATGVLPLPARMLVLEPDRRRFYLVYRAARAVPYREGEERSVRVRTEVSS